ncbi:MAG: DUF2911 domain-containing protein [Chitinophagaceae bacterium]|nr:DUF2911 domain-containing protein [Chitinophagaceae bacterium]
MLRATILFLCMLPTLLFAQNNKPISGYLVYLLGKDTTMAGYYELKGNQFSMEVLARPNVSVTKMKGTLYPNGDIESAEGHAFRAGRDPQLIANYRLYVRDDSTFIEQQQPGRTLTVSRFPGRGVMTNAIGAPFRYFIPFWVNYAPKGVGDSLVSGHLTFGTNKKYIIKRIAKDQLYVGSTVTGMMTLYLDKNGMLKSIDAIGSSWNVTALVTNKLDLKALTDRFVAQETAAGAVAINQADSVFTLLNNTSLKIVYSRPRVRGRTIFGAVVPYDRFWRTGANAATRLVTDHTLIFGEKELPAGAYSIWTLPSQQGWTMMFNSQANVWGTEYNPAFDVLHVPMQSEQLPEVIEQFTMEIKPARGGGMLNVIWEKTKASVQFQIKP